MIDPSTIILDAGPAISIDRLHYAEALLSQRDLTVLLPEPVARELARKPGLPGSRLPQLFGREIVREEALIHLRQRGDAGPVLGAGELGVIAASERLRAARVPHVISVLDDRNAWEFALERWKTDQALTGTLGLLYLIHERGLARRTVDDDLALLRGAGHRISQADARLFAASVNSMVQQTGPDDRVLPAGEAWLARMRSSGVRRRARHSGPAQLPPPSRER